jgi:hypothetical protein
MLSGVGDKSASGSVRAQIVDEISGLSGIEGVIKGVSLDNTRNGRELKRLEKRVDETSAKLHDEEVLDREERILTTARDSLEEQRDALEAAGVCQQLSDEWTQACDAVTSVESDLAVIPDVDRAEGLIQEATEAMGLSKEAADIHEQFEAVEGQIRACTDALDAIPPLEDAQNAISRHLDFASKSNRLASIRQEYEACEADEHECNEKLKLADGADRAAPFLLKAQEALESSKALRDVMMAELEVDTDIKTIERQLRDADTRLAEAIEKQDEILKSIKVCPLTLAPISEECLKEAGVKA